MRVLLISANTEPFPEAVFPIGAVYVGSALQHAGARVRIFDMRFNSRLSSLQREIREFRPDRIGLSLRNIDNAAYPSTRYYVPSYAAIAQSARSVSDCPIIPGGAAYSLFPVDLSHALGTERGVIGEGEGAGPVLIDGGQAGAAAARLDDLSAVSFPSNIREMFPRFDRYRTIGVQTARGCPNRCIYCTYPVLEGRYKRARQPEQVAGEMAMLYRDHGIRSFFIVDSLFNSDETHMERTLQKIAALRLPVRFSCYLQPRVSDPAIFSLLREAGCVAVDFGTDSGSPHMLASLGKPFGREAIVAASTSCRKTGIDFCHSLLFGGPGETEETIGETVELMDRLSPRAVVAMTGIRIYPGTRLSEIAQKEGIVRTGESLLEPRFYFPTSGPAALLRTVRELTSGRRNWFFPGRKDWSATIGYRLLNLVYRRGPLWRTFRK